jgi:fibronectin type 3 domain-containing protein
MPLFLAILVILGWNPNTESDLAGYNVYYGNASRIYTNRVNVGNVTSNRVSGLVPGQKYFFAVTAYNAAGAESDYSEEVSYLVPTQPEVITLAATKVTAIRLSWGSVSGGVYQVESTIDPSWQWFGWMAEATNLVASSTGMVWSTVCDEPGKIYRVVRLP